MHRDMGTLLLLLVLTGFATPVRRDEELLMLLLFIFLAGDYIRW